MRAAAAPASHSYSCFCSCFAFLLPLLLRPQGHSVDGLQFLEGLGLNLSTIVRLGGHSFPRTHSNPVGECQHTKQWCTNTELQ
jgi:hypothetical protein